MVQVPARVEQVTGLRIVIPGEPVAQGRPRAYRMGAGIRIVDPEKSRSWKGVAATFYSAAVGRVMPFPEGPLVVQIDACFTRPKSMPKRNGTCRWFKASRPDCDNLGKGVCDAANGILWADDAQVVQLTVRKWYCSVGESPCVEVVVAPLLAPVGGA